MAKEKKKGLSIVVVFPGLKNKAFGVRQGLFEKWVWAEGLQWKSTDGKTRLARFFAPSPFNYSLLSLAEEWGKEENCRPQITDNQQTIGRWKLTRPSRLIYKNSPNPTATLADFFLTQPTCTQADKENSYSTLTDEPCVDLAHWVRTNYSGPFSHNLYISYKIRNYKLNIPHVLRNHQRKEGESLLPIFPMVLHF